MRCRTTRAFLHQYRVREHSWQPPAQPTHLGDGKAGGAAAVAPQVLHQGVQGFALPGGILGALKGGVGFLDGLVGLQMERGRDM